MQRTKFIAVILDLNLNGSNGFDLLPAILKNSQNVVIFYDEFNDEALRSCRSLGVRAFIDKHAKSSALVAGVKAVIEGRQVLPVEWLDTPSLLPEMKAQQWVVLIGAFSPPKSGCVPPSAYRRPGQRAWHAAQYCPVIFQPKP